MVYSNTRTRMRLMLATHLFPKLHKSVSHMHMVCF